MNRVMSSMATPLFTGIDLLTAQLIVWGVHHEKYTQTLQQCSQRGIELSKAELYELAQFFRHVLLIDVSREEQARCTVCRDALMPQEELLCECYSQAQEGVFIEPTHSAIDWHKTNFPDTWRNKIQSRYICKNKECRQIQDVPLEVVDKKLQSGKPWNAPKYCHGCYLTWANSRRSSFPPKLGEGRKSTIPTPPSAQTSEDSNNLRAALASVAPQVGES